LLCREKKTGSFGLVSAQGVIQSSDLVIQVIVVPGKENRIFWSGVSPRRHPEQRSRHSGDCCDGKRKQDLLVWCQPKAPSRAAISSFR
jgi:hypothetical protein